MKRVLIPVMLLLVSCGSPSEESSPAELIKQDPMARDSFTMRNPEILEDLLEQLELHGIEHWQNEDNSIGFYVKDTRQVDLLAQEAIGVWVSLQ